MITHCEACKVEIVAEDIVVACEGLCEAQRHFHARCVGLSYDEGCACLHRNIFWMCDSCRDAIERGRFRNSFTDKNSSGFATKNEVECLKSEVNRINAIVSQMVTSSNASKQPTPEQPVVRDPVCRSPLSSTRMNASDHLDILASNDTVLQLYVSNIAPDVTEHEVKQMVCESIGANDVYHVKCLAPSWRDTSTLNCISYKVTVDAKLRDCAFKASNWPSGVRCREFRDFSNSVWRPSSRESQYSLAVQTLYT